MKNKRTTQGAIVITVLVIAIVGYYCFLVNRQKAFREENTPTTIQSVLVRDLVYDYPPSPKEVIRYYNEIIKCFYNEDCTEEEIEALAAQARKLYDDELVSSNEWEEYLINLNTEIKESKISGRKLTSCAVSSAADVEFFDEDGYSFARLRSSYNMMQGSIPLSAMEVYLLRRDEAGHWRIYGWKDASELEAAAGGNG